MRPAHWNRCLRADVPKAWRKRWTGIVRARRERLERLSVAEVVDRWREVKPLILDHLEADDACLAGRLCSDVEIPAALSLPSALKQAHAQRNAARRDPAPAPEVAEHLARLRVHLALLAGRRSASRTNPCVWRSRSTASMTASGRHLAGRMN